MKTHLTTRVHKSPSAKTSSNIEFDRNRVIRPKSDAYDLAGTMRLTTTKSNTQLRKSFLQRHVKIIVISALVVVITTTILSVVIFCLLHKPYCEIRGYFSLYELTNEFKLKIVGSQMSSQNIHLKFLKDVPLLSNSSDPSSWLLVDLCEAKTIACITVNGNMDMRKGDRFKAWISSMRTFDTRKRFSKEFKSCNNTQKPNHRTKLNSIFIHCGRRVQGRFLYLKRYKFAREKTFLLLIGCRNIFPIEEPKLMLQCPTNCSKVLNFCIG